MGVNNEIQETVTKLMALLKSEYNLSDKNIRRTIRYPEELIDRIVCFVVNHSGPGASASDILSKIVTTTAISTAENGGTVKDILYGKSKGNKVRIAYLTESFGEGFLEKTENSFSGGIVYGRNLTKNHLGGNQLLDELGGKKKTETTMLVVLMMLRRQARGARGALLVGGEKNIFFIRDINKQLVIVTVHWTEAGWFFSSYPLKSGERNGMKGARVFSVEL